MKHENRQADEPYLSTHSIARKPLPSYICVKNGLTYLITDFFVCKYFMLTCGWPDMFTTAKHVLITD